MYISTALIPLVQHQSHTMVTMDFWITHFLIAILSTFFFIVLFCFSVNKMSTFPGRPLIGYNHPDKAKTIWGNKAWYVAEQ